MGENKVTELDFDELDRAVNSLISTNSSARMDDVSDEKTLTLEEPEEALPASTTPSADPAASDPAAATAAQPPLAAKRSSGRFMDVVHPSSDMRPMASHASEMHISPIIPSASTTTTDNNQAVDPVVAAPTAPVTNEWPDPLDYTAPKDAVASDSVTATPEQPSQESPAATENDDDIDAIANDINNSLGSAPTDDVQTSPFLADTKVDKRPLGAFSGTETGSAAVTTTPAPTVELPPITPLASPASTEPGATTTGTQDDAQIPPGVADEAPLPEELQSDLLNIEADTSASQAVEAPLSPTVEVKPAEPEVPVGPTAITQQYKEEPTTGDTQSGAIFDTKSYHKPLAQPEKKKSKGKLFIWILVLVVLGGGIGAGIYYYVLPVLT